MEHLSKQPIMLPGAAGKSSGIGRRRVLQWLGMGVAGIAAGAAGAQTVVGQAVHPVGGVASSQSTDSAKRLRRWAMVIDLCRCDGCQSIGKPPQCTLACIEGHFAPEPMEWVQVYESALPGGGTQFIPTPCQQCQNPPCVNVCPVGATFSTPEGVVLVDQGRCIGCRICMEACPYDRRFFNWGRPPLPPEALFIEYDPEHQAPAQRGTVMKCDFCPDMARAGRLPYCAQACPNNAIYYGDLEENLATNGAEVVEISRFLSENAGYRLKEDLGTEPRVFYIPGQGQAVGRSAYRTGRKPTEWPWQQRVTGVQTWTR